LVNAEEGDEGRQLERRVESVLVHVEKEYEKKG